MITDPWFYLFAVPAVLIAGIAKGGFSGLMVLSVPIMAILVDPRLGAAIILPIICVMDLLGVWRFRKHWDKSSLIVLLPASLLGIIIGAASFQWFSVDGLRLVIGLISLGFVANWWLNRKHSQETRVPGKISGYFWGTLAGFTSFSAHSGAAPASIYLLPQRLDKVRLAGTFAIFFAVVNYVKLVPYAFLGQLGTANLSTSLALLPIGYVGIKLGFWLHSRVSEKHYYQISYGLLFLIGLKLIYDACSNFMGNFNAL